MDTYIFYIIYIYIFLVWISCFLVNMGPNGRIDQANFVLHFILRKHNNEARLTTQGFNSEKYKPACPTMSVARHIRVYNISCS